MILLFFILSILFWLGASVVDTFIFYKGTFLNNLLSPNPADIGIRLLVILFLDLLCVYFQFVITKLWKKDYELDRKFGLIPEALDMVGALVVIFDASGKILRFNKACEAVTGYTFDEVRGQYFWKLFLDNEEALLIKDDLSKLFNKSNTDNFPKEYENYWNTKTRKRKLIKWSNTVIYNSKNEPAYIIGVGIDITLHKDIGEVLEEAQEDYKILIDNVGLGISLVSSELRVIYANSQIKGWFSNHSIGTRPISHNILSNFSSNECSVCPVCKSLADGNIHEAALEISNAKGIFSYRTIAYPVKNDKGRIIASIEVVEDFTSINEKREEIRRNALVQASVNSILRFSLENISLDSFVKCILSVILSTPVTSSLSAGAVYLIEDDSDVLVMRAQGKIPSALLEDRKRIPFGKYSCGKAAIEKRAVFAYSPTFSKVGEGDTKDADFAHYCIPIMYSGQILGVIDIFLEKTHKYNRQEEEFLTAIANSVSGVIQRKRQEERLNKINKCFVDLSIDPSENIEKIISLTRDVLRANFVIYNRIVQAKKTFQPKDQTEIHESLTGLIDCCSDACYNAFDKESQNSFVIENLADSPYLENLPKQSSGNFKTYLGQIVSYSNSCIGVLSVFYKSYFSPSEEDRRLLGIISSAIGVEEERLRSSYELKEAYAKLQEAQDNLIHSEKLAALGRFSSGVAHEVKNPLGVVLGGIEFLERKLGDAEKDVETAVKKIKESTLRADGIVRNLLAFSQPSEIKTEKIALKDLLEDTLSLLRYRVTMGNLNIKTYFLKEHIDIDADKNQLQQVLFNLLMNSVEAMPRGGTIQIKVYKSRVPELDANLDSAVVEIIDSGEGITDENMPKLFEPFFTTKRDRKGTGLGLSISKMIVESHKGILCFENRPKKGVSAKIVLPIT